MKENSKIIRVDKPWGYELIWAKTEKYVGKILHLQKGKRLSYQYHLEKDEAILVHSGKLIVELGEENGGKKIFNLNSGESLHIPPFTRHRLTAVEDSDIFEVSTPQLNDVVRLEDDHGRI